MRGKGSFDGLSAFDRRLADFDLVDPALLVPPDHPFRGSSRPDAALVVDRELTRLAGAEAHGRVVIAQLAARLVRLRAWRRLGFVRLSDYSRERLGVAPRTLEEDARVIGILESLPCLREAIETGATTWTRLRLLVRVATQENEEQLLRESLALTTRQLEEFLRGRQRGASGQPGSGDTADPARRSAADGARDGGAPDGGAPDGDAPDGAEEGSRDRRGGEAESRGNGSRLGGEAFTQEEDPEVSWNIAISRRGRRLWRTACEMASRSAGSPLGPAQVLEHVCAEACSSAPPHGAGESPRWTPSAADIEARLLSSRRGSEARGHQWLQAFLAEAGVIEGFPWLSPATGDTGPAHALDRLLDGLEHADAFELDRRLRAARTAAQRLDAQMATLLRIGVDRRLFRELGFATTRLYVESRLGISARKVWSLIAIERASWRCCRALREAWRLGQISHLAAQALLPVIGERHGDAWVRRAREVTLRRLVDEVAWALEHRQSPSAFDPPAPPAPEAVIPPNGLGGVSTDEVQMRAHGEAGDCSRGPVGAIRLGLRLPLSVALLAETTIGLLGRDGEPRWRTFERVVALALVEWLATPRHRDPVFERDGWRCTVPGCSSRRNLQDHHVMFRSRGGGNARDNRTTVCAAHHLHGIHAGIVRARGRAPQAMTWELGCRRGEEPLMRLRGDRYEQGAPGR